MNKNRKHSLLTIMVVLFFIAVTSSCGGGGLTVSGTFGSSTSAITISADAVVVATGSTLQLSAVDEDGTDITSSVTWSVAAVSASIALNVSKEADSDTYGSISTDGLYTPPTTIPNAGITITAELDEISATFTVTQIVGGTVSFLETEIPITSFCDTGYTDYGALLLGTKGLLVDETNEILYASWGGLCAMDDDGEPLFDFQSFTANSTDNGVTWSTSLDLHPGTWSVWPHTALDSSNNVNIGLPYVDDGEWSTAFTRSTSSGSTFASPTNVSMVDADATGMFPYAILIDSNDTIYILTQEVDEEPEEYSKLYLLKSADSGSSFSNLGLITQYTGKKDSACTMNPSMAFNSGGNIEIVYQRRDSGLCGQTDEGFTNLGNVYRKTYSVSGGTFSDETQINSTSDNINVNPDLAIDSSDVIHAVWASQIEMGGATAVNYARSSDWSSVQIILASAGKFNGISSCASDENCGINSYAPVTAIDAFDNINIAYYTWDGTNMDIYLRRSRDGGDTWDDSVKVNTTSGLANLNGQFDPYLSIITRSNGVPIVFGALHDGSIYKIYIFKGDR